MVGTDKPGRSHPPNSQFLGEHLEHDEVGYLVTDRDMRSSIPGFFVAGDIRAQLVKQITTAVGDATTAVFAVEKYLKELEEAAHVEELEEASAASP